MGNIIDQLLSNPLHLVIAALLVVTLIVGIIKRVMKLIVFLIIALIAFVGYLHFTGRDVPTTAEELKESVAGQVDKVKDSASQAVDEAVQDAKDDLADKLKGDQ